MNGRLLHTWLQSQGLSGEFTPMDIDAMYNLCLDDLYEGIVSSVYDASVSTVARVKSTPLKPFWNEELDSL